jgi:hypothetical protein
VTVAAILDLDRAIASWSADTLESDDLDRARSILCSLVVRLGGAAASGFATRPRRSPRSCSL